MTFTGTGPSRGFRVSPRSADGIEHSAQQLRDALGVTGPRFDAAKVLEGLSRYGIAVDIVEDGATFLPLAVEACWLPDRATMYLRESVYLGACNQEGRALFTVAHELGHLALLHQRSLIHREVGPIRTFEDSEWQANTFASAFLMPRALVEALGITTVEQMMAVFGVSWSAAKIRVAKVLKACSTPERRNGQAAT